MSPISEAQKRATAKYEAKKYDKPVIRMEKGKKDIIAAHAKKNNESFNGFVNRAIDETMERDKSADSTQPRQHDKTALDIMMEKYGMPRAEPKQTETSIEYLRRIKREREDAKAQASNSPTK